jgi:ABC-type branched-subunit amino acid transport system ATPase component
MSILKIDNVTMKFGGVTAVNNLNIEIQEVLIQQEEHLVLHLWV